MAQTRSLPGALAHRNQIRASGIGVLSTPRPHGVTPY